ATRSRAPPSRCRARRSPRSCASWSSRRSPAPRGRSRRASAARPSTPRTGARPGERAPRSPSPVSRRCSSHGSSAPSAGKLTSPHRPLRWNSDQVCARLPVTRIVGGGSGGPQMITPRVYRDNVFARTGLAVDATSKDIRRYRARAHAAGTLTPEVERMLDDLQRDPHQRIVQELFAPRRTDPSSCPAVGAALTILGRLPRGGLWPGGTTKLWGTGHSGLLLVGVGVGVGVATLLEGAVHLDAVEGWTVSRGCALTTYVGASWFAGDDGWPAFVVAIGLAVVTVAAYLGVRHEPLDGLIPDRGPAHAGRRRDRHGDPDDRCRHDGDLRGRGAGRTGGDGPGGGAFRSAASVVRSPMEENGLRAWWRNRRQRR